MDEFSDLPTLKLPENVEVVVCSTEVEIQHACSLILEKINEKDILYVGFDTEWEFSTTQFTSRPQKTALVQIALPSTVYLFRIFLLKQLPSSLCVILNSPQIIKIGCGVGGDLAKLAKDFSNFKLPKKAKKESYPFAIELGALAKAKNVVTTGTASLAQITAETLHQNLSKDV